MSAVSGSSIHTAHKAQLGNPRSSAYRGSFTTPAVHFGSELPPISAKKALWSLAKYPVQNAGIARLMLVHYAKDLAELSVFLPGGFLLYVPLLGGASLLHKFVRPRLEKKLTEQGYKLPTTAIQGLTDQWKNKSWKPQEATGHKNVQEQFAEFIGKFQEFITEIVFQKEIKNNPNSDIVRAVTQYKPLAEDLKTKGLKNWGYNFLGSAFYSDAYYDGTKVGKVINFLKTQTKTRNPAVSAANRIFKNRLLRILTGPMRLVGLVVQALLATHFRVSGRMARELANAIR